MAAPILPISGAALPQPIRPVGQTGSGGGFQDVLASAIHQVEAVRCKALTFLPWSADLLPERTKGSPKS